MIIGKLRDMMRGRDGEWVISFTTRSDIRELFDDLAGKDIKIDIKRYFKQRSLSANSYAWVLIDKIAEKMHVSKTFVYQMAIRDIGGVSQAVCVQTEKKDEIKRWWTSKGLGWQVDEMPSKLEGCTNLMLYCGSSEFDTKQMSALISSLVQEAEGLGIPTVTSKEYQAMLEKWGKNERTESASAGGTEGMLSDRDAIGA